MKKELVRERLAAIEVELLSIAGAPKNRVTAAGRKQHNRKSQLYRHRKELRRQLPKIDVDFRWSEDHEWIAAVRAQDEWMVAETIVQLRRFAKDLAKAHAPNQALDPEFRTRECK